MLALDGARKRESEKSTANFCFCVTVIQNFSPHFRLNPAKAIILVDSEVLAGDVRNMELPKILRVNIAMFDNIILSGSFLLGFHRFGSNHHQQLEQKPERPHVQVSFLNHGHSHRERAPPSPFMLSYSQGNQEARKAFVPIL